MSHRLHRRSFLATSAAIASTSLLSARNWTMAAGANDRLRVAAVGVGGKGWSDLTGVSASPKVEVTSLCDIDESMGHLGRAAEKFPQAKRYSDWRKLLDDERDFDAVIVATPDFMHAPVALAAMHRKKHAFSEKPLTHTVFEARQMALVAKQNKLVTQMGNQIQSHEAYRSAVAIVHAGLIGKVKEVHSWQAGKMGWRLVDDRPAGADEIPAGLHWDNWLGVAPERPFKKQIYHSFNWRAWQDFSNGQLGDFGCHILDPVFMALKLAAPLKVQAEAPEINREVWTLWSKVRYEFPSTELTLGPTIPLTWYDGDGNKPKAESVGLPASYSLPGSGSVLIGEKGTLVIPHVAAPKLFPEEKFANVDLPKLSSVDHYVGWADACRGEGKTTSHFGYAGNLTETVLLGTIAIRLPNQSLHWDVDALRFANSEAATALLKKPYRKGWEPTWI